MNLHLYLENVFSIENYLQRYLFDKINKVLRSDKIQYYSTIKINVQAYGIQADYLDGIEKDSAGEKAVMTVSQLTEIYGYISDTE